MGKNASEDAHLQEKGLPFIGTSSFCLLAVVLAMAFAEGSANDWLLLMVDDTVLLHNLRPLIHAGFTLAYRWPLYLGGCFGWTAIAGDSSAPALMGARALA